MPPRADEGDVERREKDNTNDSGDKLLSVVGSVTKSFSYDALGRRKTKTVSGQTQTYTWDGESRLTGLGSATYADNGLDARVSATDALGSRTFRRDGASVTSPLMGDGLATYTPGASERRGGVSRYLHSGLKNADARTVGSTTLEATRTYDAFGNLTASSGSWTGQQGYAGSFGYQEDPSGLMLLGHRYYDAEVGRFISRDPIGDGRNWYGYCGNNPLRRVDPSGLVKVEVYWYEVAGGAKHIGIKVTDNVRGSQTYGESWYYAGGPESFGYVNNGKLVSKVGPADSNHQDGKKKHDDSVTIVDDQTPASVFREQFADKVASDLNGKKNYKASPDGDPNAANSNSWAHDFLKALGLLDDFMSHFKKGQGPFGIGGGRKFPWAPGWGHPVL